MRCRLRFTAILISALTALLLTIGLSACGGGSDDGATSATSAERVPSPTTPSGGNVDPADVQVVLAWATTLQRGDVRGAAMFFALPSAVSNGGRPIALRTRAAVQAFNRSLPCGADLIGTRAAADGFFVATFRLTDRPGGDCGTGTGNTASTALHVTDGLIDHWLRVQDLEAEPAPGTPS
ncbi:hypothetical protein [Conexibacter sp. CPCC 206217]|uniref:hypothetical protein n=1 Tax=Conexibacter sp. CPCC 206217 TaxID=3064574 RepID=UPI002727631D|nr:hypothetical protein [Conexibacter sp. CPCC 206217]MDO8209055.1 hypothetical protein [Conexibacter sp. CPCC 206217]